MTSVIHQYCDSKESCSLIRSGWTARLPQLGLLSALLLAIALPAEGATRYVRAGAAGNGSGSDWTNAYASLPATLIRGDTYYIAAGNYSAYTFDDPESGSLAITIKKATSGDHGTDAGWQSAFSGQAVFNSVLRFERGNYIFDGQTRNENDWFAGAAYGFKISSNNNAAQQQLIVTGSNVTIKYTWAEGRRGAYNGAERRYAVDTEGGGTTNNPVFHRMLVTDSNNVWFLRNSNGAIVEYCAHTGATGNAENHGEIVNLYFTAENSVIRYNQFTNAYTASGGTALIAIADSRGTSNPPRTEIYGNLFWNYGTTDATIGFLGNSANGGNATNSVVVNNTFVDGHSGYGWGIQFPDGSGNIVRNNLFIRGNGSPTTALNLGSGATNSNNGFGTGSGSSGSNARTGLPTSIFVGYSGYSNLRLATPVSGGAPLPAPYNQDMFGNIRGADGVWDIGAFEYSEGGSLPTPPTNLRTTN